MSSILPFVLIALAAGMTVPTQAGINARLNLLTHSPVLAAAISFAVGTLVLTAYTLILRIPYPALSDISRHPWWVWTGGFLGAFFVTSTIILAPRVGATYMLVLILAGQMAASLVLDHFGWIGYPVREIDGWKILGVALVVTGIIIMRRP